MSKSFTFKIGSDEIRITVVTDELELERSLVWLFCNIKPLPRTFHRVVGFGIEKSFRSTIDGAVSEKVARLKLYMCRK
jgi:hypothetical protein